ncbi:hypothetical protein [Streptomyces albipurpureus]|uniref:Knr4/Smi1-like domain-containing protein n=1 Tax=Streptomyces albipurpureus TaxID=2897419 RepID=A0ABT0V0B6_9ACTN|nr:hypothetical protein [Streptomyces sp. CWNU-1]MCM2394112.1 hypothetical protein [Streptomyces sp. CWNU-1]
MMDEGDAGPVHGVALVERVIEVVRRDPGASVLPYRDVPWVEEGVASPMDEGLLAKAVFPSGHPLSPSLRAWLAFDTSLLERHRWFTPDGGFAPRPLDQLVGEEMGAPWAGEFTWLAERFDECFLLPGGSDSRRILAVTEPDVEGEYPVLALDFDDLPFLGLMYPGFDVYLADTVNLLGRGDPRDYTELIDHQIYGHRMRGHASHCFAGDVCVEFPFESTPVYAQLRSRPDEAG